MSDDKPSMTGPRSSGTVRSTLARAVHQHRAFLELARIVAGSDQGVWTGALPTLLAPSGAAWGAAFRVNGTMLELVASEALPMAVRAHVETFELGRDSAFAACRAFRSRRPVSDERLFSGVVSARTLASLEAAGIAAGTAVPIVHSGTVLGVLVVGPLSREPIDADGLAFLGAAASFLAPALAIAERSHDAADRISTPPHSVSAAIAAIRKVADVGRAATEAVQQAAPVLRGARVDLTSAGDDDCFALGDGGELRLAIAHLIVNATEAAADRAPVASAPSLPRRVRLTVRREGAAIAVCVEDSGRGVPHDLRARVFEAGFSTKGKGRGNGLHLVRQIALEQGGHVEVAASELGGASFRLLLPATSARPDPATAGRRHNTSATWPQMRAAGRGRSARQTSGSSDDGEPDPASDDWLFDKVASF